jgi:hypothetical protein
MAPRTPEDLVQPPGTRELAPNHDVIVISEILLLQDRAVLTSEASQGHGPRSGRRGEVR